MPRSLPSARSSRRLHRLITLLGTTLAGAPLAFSADFYKANNETNLNQAASWEDADHNPVGSAPQNSTNSTDVFIWDERVQADGDNDGIHYVMAGNNLGVRTIRILNPAYPVHIYGSGYTFTPTNTGGIDMSQATQDLTLENIYYRVASSGNTIHLRVAPERTLTFLPDASVTVRENAGNVTVNINNDGTSTGTVLFNGPFFPSNVVIGGGWVEFNNPTGNSRIGGNSTVVNGGTLVVNNTSGSATGSGPVTVNENATLTGNGIIGGTVTANAGSILSPGVDDIGTLRVGALNLEEGSTYVWEAENTAESDRIQVSNADGLTINGGTIKLHNPGTTEPFSGTGTYTLFEYTGAIGGAGIEALTIDESTMIPGRFYQLGLGAGTVTVRILTEAITPIDWTVDADGNWSSGANWSGGVAPDEAQAIARIPGESGVTFSAPRTITLDAPTTVGQLLIDSPQPVTLGGSAALTFDDSGSTATLSATGAHHSVLAPIQLTQGGLLASVDAPAGRLTLANVVSGTDHGLVMSGTGTLVLAADNTYTGTTSVAGGVLEIGDGGTTGSVAGPIATSGTVRFNRTGSLTLSAPISGTGSVQFAGASTITLASANTYTGATTLSSGSLVLAHGQALQNTTLDYLQSGGSLVVDPSITSLTIGALTGDRPFPLTNTAAAPLALTIGGNNQSTTFSGSSLGTGAGLTKNGSGSLTLQNGTYSFDDGIADDAPSLPAADYKPDTAINAGALAIGPGATYNTAGLVIESNATAQIAVAGGTLNVAAETWIKNSTIATGGIFVSGGVANFNGGIRTDTNNSSNFHFINVTGGTLNAAHISTSRGSLNNSSEPNSAPSTQGLFINGGAVNVAGALDIGTGSGANSSVAARMDSGSLTVGGLITVGINNTSRWSTLDINGGTLQAAGGIRLGSAYAGNVVMHIRKSSAVVSTPFIQFGQGDLAGQAKLHLTDGTLYVGAGGLFKGSTNEGFNHALTMANGGTLGATADWSSSIPVTLTGKAYVTAADVSDNPYTITLGGPVTGLGSLVKSGSGTVYLTSEDNEFSGPLFVDYGTLGISGSIIEHPVYVEPTGTFAPLGVFRAPEFLVYGGVEIRYNRAAPVPVGRAESDGMIDLGDSATLTVTAAGSRPLPGTYVIMKAPLIAGGFSSVSLPEGVNLIYNYDDGDGLAAIALEFEDIGSPYDTWAASHALAGADALASADPDGDGLPNLLEFAFGSSPTEANPSPWTVDRSGDFLTISFDHPADPGLTYAVEATSDLAAGPWETVHTFPTFTTAGTATYTDSVDLSTAGVKRFLRIKISAE